MKAKTAVVVAVALLACAVTARGGDDAETRMQGIEKRLPATMKLADRMQAHKATALSLAVISDGRVEWARGFGVTEAGGRPVTADTLFQAGSISKPVSALAALRLVEQGKLDLDEDVNVRLKSWKVPENRFTREQKVTLRRILTHSAGLNVHGFNGYVPGAAVPGLVQVLNGENPANSPPIAVEAVPGSRFQYSGGGFIVMQQLMIDVTGKPFPELMKEMVLDPAGMKHSTFEQPLPSRLAADAAAGHVNGKVIEGRYQTQPEMAAAGLWTTAGDLAALAVEMEEEVAGKSGKILSQKMAQEMTKTQFGGYGLGVVVGGSPARFSHSGINKGFEGLWFAYRDSGRGAVILTNAQGGSGLATELFRAISREYNWP